MKAKYKTKLIQKMIRRNREQKTLSHISILETMKMLVFEWNNVSSSTIQTCFKETCFCNNDEDNDLSDDPLFILIDSIKQLSLGDESLVTKDVTSEKTPSDDDLVATQLPLKDKVIAVNILGHNTTEENCKAENSSECIKLVKKNQVAIRYARVLTLY